MRTFLIIPFDHAKDDSWFVVANDKEEAVRLLQSYLGRETIASIGDLLVSIIPSCLGVVTPKRLKTWACNLTGIKPFFVER